MRTETGAGTGREGWRRGERAQDKPEKLWTWGRDVENGKDLD